MGGFTVGGMTEPAPVTRSVSAEKAGVRWLLYPTTNPRAKKTAQTATPARNSKMSWRTERPSLFRCVSRYSAMARDYKPEQRVNEGKERPVVVQGTTTTRRSGSLTRGWNPRSGHAARGPAPQPSAERSAQEGTPLQASTWARRGGRRARPRSFVCPRASHEPQA